MNSESFKLVVSISGNDQTRAQYKLCCIFFEGRPKNVGDIFVIFIGENNEKKLYS